KEDSKQPTRKKDVQHDNEIMVVAEVAKTNIVFFNQEEVVGEAYQASDDQTTAVSVEEQTLEVEKTKDEASQSIYLQASTGQTTAVFVEEQTIEVAQTEVVMSHQEENIGEASQPILMESEVDVTLKKGHALAEKEINERDVKMACEIDRMHDHLDELLPGVLLEYFI
ncbi:hypothetical protein GIB67_001422, partial [Kingdonia uniflora]